MDYAKHYQTLMDRAEGRMLVGYSERHHVVPRCLDKASEVTAQLTPEEHYVAHQLLVKMHPGHRGLILAARHMTFFSENHQGHRNNKLFGWLRRQASETQRGNKHGLGYRHTDEAKRLISEAGIGNTYSAGVSPSAATRKKIGDAARGRKQTAEHRAKNSAAKIGNKASLGMVHSTETRALISKRSREAFANGAKKPDQSSPEYRARHSVLIKAALARRKARLAAESAA